MNPILVLIILCAIMLGIRELGYYMLKRYFPDDMT